MPMSKELLEYECPCCGGKIEFNSNIQKPQCPYCDTVFELDALKYFDEVLKQDAPDEMHWEKTEGEAWGEGDGMAVYTCRSCGGDVVCDDTTAATSSASPMQVLRLPVLSRSEISPLRVLPPACSSTCPVTPTAYSR